MKGEPSGIDKDDQRRIKIKKKLHNYGMTKEDMLTS